MTIKEVLDRTVQFFKEKKFETARLDAELLLSHTLGLKDRVALYLKFDQPMKEDELVRCREAVRRRSQGEPVAYILGTKGFFGFDFVVNKNTLIPRPETEILVEKALSKFSTETALHAYDFGTGSGCIGLSLAKKLPNATVTLVDGSGAALEVASENAKRLGVSERVTVVHSLVEKLETGKAQLILANPPYIDRNDTNVEENVRKFEPDVALFADDNGLNALQNWAGKAAELLEAKGWYGFEMGKDQAETMRDFLQSLGTFENIEIVKDLAGFNRHIFAQRK